MSVLNWRMTMRAVGRSGLFILLLVSCLTVFGARSTSANVIFVTTLQQKVGGPGGCSLQEAIYSANQDSNVFSAFDASGAPILVTSACASGSGDDVIVLPTGGVILLMNSIVDDANNPTGPTATPIITSNITIEGNGASLQWVSANLFARAFAVGDNGNLTLDQL